MGKSRLVERFAKRSGAPFLFYAATGAFPRDDLARLARDAQASTLPLAGLVAAARPESWTSWRGHARSLRHSRQPPT